MTARVFLNFSNATQEWWIEELRFSIMRKSNLMVWIDMNEPANFGTNEEHPWNWPEGRQLWSLSCRNTTWDDPPCVTNMMEFNLFGIPYIGADICGFFREAKEMCHQ
ncbi:sucrase-isomaltase, intestinal-like [Scylla paramamosain]|uniref:sucrase-isomaltase, intestinal-like n=1 Tax=Scylla paramamosain TaxID=85552 RepID=UPI0030833447